MALVYPAHTLLPLRWRVASVDKTGRFVITRVQKPRCWILWDMDNITAPLRSTPGWRVGVYKTRAAAREKAVAIARSLVFDPLYPNMPIDPFILPDNPA